MIGVTNDKGSKLDVVLVSERITGASVSWMTGEGLVTKFHAYWTFRLT